MRERLRPALVEAATQHRMLAAALAAAIAFHGSLLAAGTFRRTYDAYVHIFFADHYARGWFETWEPRWYTGFTVTSYPPGAHQLVALVSRMVGLEAAYAMVQLAGILLVVIGVYRLTGMIADRRAAGFAAWLTVLSTSIAEAVHVFGQLPTICALGLLLNALPYAWRWVLQGDRRHLVAAVGMLAGTTALHHVTTLFGAVFFVGPVVVAALVNRLRTPLPDEEPARPAIVQCATFIPLVARRLRRIVRPVGRTAVLTALVIGVLVVVVFPYWVWSSTDPISQVPIPHASRDSFLDNLNAGLIFWLIPWGLLLLVFPYAVARTVRSAAWPYMASVGVLALLGTGGTTPIPRLVLGGAHEILTLDRFTFWATILILPFAGMAASDLVHGGLGARMVRVFGEVAVMVTKATLVLALVATAVFTANLTHFRRMQPDPIDPAPIVSFLEKDMHDHWRYLTLGFGDQMAWLAAQTTAQTVDGNYHSARRLPELITAPVERLEGAKFRGIPGLGSLQQFLGTPERYHLKFVFSNDRFYDPLLYFSGWRTVETLDNGVVVWEREDVAPLPGAIRHTELPPIHGLMWGVLPPAALLAAALVSTAGWWRPRPPSRGVVAAALERRLRALASVPQSPDGGVPSWKEPFRRLARAMQAPDRLVRVLGITVAGMVVVGVAAAAMPRSHGAADVIEAFYDDLDFRRFERSWERLYPPDRPSLDEYLLRLSVEDGLVDSYAALDSVVVTELRRYPGGATASVDLVWVTSLAEYRRSEQLELVEDDAGWWIVLDEPDPSESVEPLARRVEVAFEPAGRRTATTASTEYDDVLDRPELAVTKPRLVLLDGSPTVVGEVRIVDADPGSLTVTAGLVNASGAIPLRSNARQVIQHSLLPWESTPYRVDFEGVAGTETADFDPAEFTLVDMPVDPVSVLLDVKAVVTSRGLERPVTIQDVTVSLDAQHRIVVEGETLNLGTADMTVTGILASLYDIEGQLIWVDWVIVPEAARPGLSVRFATTLTARDRLEPVDLPGVGRANGLSTDMGAASEATIPVPPQSGYAGITLMPVVFQRSSS